MTRYGLIGGTFDPFHNGHRRLVEAVNASDGIDRVILMVAGQQPHKTRVKVSAASYRFEMAVRGVSDLENVTVSDMEINRKGRSFTIDTLNELTKNMSDDDQLILVYGSDVLFDLPNWREPAAILLRYPLLIAARGGIARQAAEIQAEKLRCDYQARISFMEQDMIELSATSIRDMLVAKQPHSHLIPDRVAAMIEHHDLYGYDDELTTLDPELWGLLADYERQLRPLLNTKRLLHSLNVMRYAMHLAMRHGIDVKKAAIAGLLHDCAKCLEAHTVLHYARLAGDPQLVEAALAHGPAGAYLAKRDFGINDTEILRAIHFHTTGNGDMSPLDLLIYVADKVEPARTYNNLEGIRIAAENDLEQAMRLCLVEVEAFLVREQKPSHPYALAALKKLNVVE
ncbi:MAG: bis(5'-nucleosyl)-tetraphosphatase (symmetrical) YqeK [Eubacteriales bacterium]|nr:bis(5'-nucleosyl)-tetraphosphatase (symmetrical) YqeK [Eubacteriales bacterium]